jgi:hypothetical protein
MKNKKKIVIVKSKKGETKSPARSTRYAIATE